ncbi:MAG: hypothetical protein A3F67_04840 [Verrucomicrobia bacterium RIFCSPHIGHO2_12_FULL_41_10]|nr:MAG: hypothetical protein A3F67_04840 [Verrucomicrobia bacterium RIFCSPHIGHO2_12_FULL_41_10]
MRIEILLQYRAPIEAKYTSRGHKLIFFTLQFLTLARRKSAALCKHNAIDDNAARVKKGL